MPPASDPSAAGRTGGHSTDALKASQLRQWLDSPAAKAADEVIRKSISETARALERNASGQMHPGR